MKRSLLPLVAASVLLTTSAHSTTIFFDLLGKAGGGLLSGNENGSIVVSPNPVGTGGEIGGGISYDDVTNALTVNVGWGSLNGFLDLSGVATMSHIHGPTASGGAAAFLQNVSVLFDLPRVSSTANGGSISTTITLSEPQELELLNGRYYVNVHTGQNGGGEIRGNVVVVPEPSHALLGVLGFALLGARRKR